MYKPCLSPLEKLFIFAQTYPLSVTSMCSICRRWAFLAVSRSARASSSWVLTPSDSLYSKENWDCRHLYSRVSFTTSSGMLRKSIWKSKWIKMRIKVEQWNHPPTTHPPWCFFPTITKRPLPWASRSLSQPPAAPPAVSPTLPCGCLPTPGCAPTLHWDSQTKMSTRTMCYRGNLHGTKTILCVWDVKLITCKKTWMLTFWIFSVIWPPGSPPELPVLLYPDFSCRQTAEHVRKNKKESRTEERKQKHTAQLHKSYENILYLFSCSDN